MKGYHRKQPTQSEVQGDRRDPEEHFAALGLQGLPDLVPPSIAAERLSVSRQTIYHLLNHGELSGIRVGPKAMRIFRASLLDYLKRRLTT